MVMLSDPDIVSDFAALLSSRQLRAKWHATAFSICPITLPAKGTLEAAKPVGQRMLTARRGRGGNGGRGGKGGKGAGGCRGGGRGNNDRKRARIEGSDRADDAPNKTRKVDDNGARPALGNTPARRKLVSTRV